MAENVMTVDQIIEAATNFVEEHGAPALTMRALGRELGADPTVVYRHFSDKADLLAAVGSSLLKTVDLSDALSAPTTRERMYRAIHQVRRTIMSKPEVGLLMMMNSDDPSAVSWIMKWGVSQLREFGFTEKDLATSYQLIIGYTFGMTCFDTCSRPDPLEVRRRWLRNAGIPEFDEVSQSSESIAALNETVFDLGLNALLDQIEEMAAAARA
jgi:AcrR family transcriptional regulator